LSSTNRVALRAIKEVTYGVTPANPAFVEIPTTAQPNLGFAPATVVSNLLRSDRQTSDLILVGGEAGGEANSEFAFGIHDDLVEGLMFSLWQTRFARRNDRNAVGISAVDGSGEAFTVAAGPTTGSITVTFAGTTTGAITRSTGSFLVDGFKAGQWVAITGAADGGNNTVAFIVSVTALVMTVLGITADEVGDAGVTIVESLPVGSLVRALGFTASANNGYHVVNGTPSGVSIPVATDLTTEASPATTSQLFHVGRRAAASDIVAVTGPNGITSTLLNFLTLDLAPGDWIKLNGTGGTWPVANNGWYRVLSVAAASIVFDVVPTGFAANSGASATVDIYHGERIINGVTRQSFALEREFSDQSPVLFQYLNGFVVDQLVLTGASQSIVGANFTFVGATSAFQDSGRFAGATSIAASAFNVLNTSSNVARIARGGVQLIGAGTKNVVTEFSLTVKNNIRRKNAFGFVGAADVEAGECSVTGSLTAFFDDKTIAEQVVNNNETSVDARYVDGSGRLFVVDCPRIKYSAGQPTVAGKNQDVTINPNFTAILHATFGYTVKFMRFQGAQ
jgi:hypothetical protein